MAPRNPSPRLHAGRADTTEAVDEFMGKLDHAFKAEIQAIRKTILSADSAIAEGIKWNAPSFRTTEYFATTNLREKAGIGIILHLGAKVRETGPDGLTISDPEGLLKWLARDRAAVVFRDLKDVIDKQSAFENLIRQWVAHV
jgi:hypothetical protein